MVEGLVGCSRFRGAAHCGHRIPLPHHQPQTYVRMRGHELAKLFRVRLHATRPGTRRGPRPDLAATHPRQWSGSWNGQLHGTITADGDRWLALRARRHGLPHRGACSQRSANAQQTLSKHSAPTLTLQVMGPRVSSVPPHSARGPLIARVSCLVGSATGGLTPSPPSAASTRSRRRRWRPTRCGRPAEPSSCYGWRRTPVRRWD
jgi:hypothetical protein